MAAVTEETKALAYALAISAARAGFGLTAVTAITLVWPTSAAETGGALPSFFLTRLCTWALVTSCSSVCTSVGVTEYWLEPSARLMPPVDWTSSCALAEYCFCCSQRHGQADGQAEQR